MQKAVKISYETVMMILVILTIMTIWRDSAYQSILNWIVWGIFFTDFTLRFFMSQKKWEFIKHNPFLLVAIIPFDQFFQMARIVRLIHLFRIKTITKYYVLPLVEHMTVRSQSLILSTILILLFAEAVLIQLLENGVGQYGDSLFVVFSYLFFFGHRIFEFEQTITIVILTMVSVLGITIQGIALQWLFNQLDVLYSRWKSQSYSRIHEQKQSHSDDK